MADYPSPTSHQVRTALDECLYAACVTSIRDDSWYDPEHIQALAALATAAAEYKATVLAVSKFRVERTREASK